MSLIIYLTTFTTAPYYLVIGTKQRELGAMSLMDMDESSLLILNEDSRCFSHLSVTHFFSISTFHTRKQNISGFPKFSGGMKRNIRRERNNVTGKYYRKFYASLAAPGKLKKNTLGVNSA